MRNIPQPVLDLMDRHECLIAGALWVDALTPFSVWSGAGKFTLGPPHVPSTTEFAGLDAPGLVPAVSFEIGQASTGIAVTLAGNNPALVPLFLQQDLRGRDCIVLWLFWDRHGTSLLWIEPAYYGSIDTAPIEETAGGVSSIRVAIEGEAQGSARSGGRIASDQDQRLIDPDDRAFEYISGAGEIQLYLDGNPPARASTIK